MKNKNKYQFNQKLPYATYNNSSRYAKSKSQTKITSRKPKHTPIQFPNSDHILSMAMNNLNKYHDNLLTKPKLSMNGIEDTKNNDFLDNLSVSVKPEPLPIKPNFDYASHCSNNASMREDNFLPNQRINDRKLLYTLRTLDLENLFSEFNLNLITFNDLFLLTKEDLIEMKIPIGPRNRILYFAEEYKKFGKNYDIPELTNFFNCHKCLVINNVEDFSMMRSYTHSNIARVPSSLSRDLMNEEPVMHQVKSPIMKEKIIIEKKKNKLSSRDMSRDKSPDDLCFEEGKRYNSYSTKGTTNNTTSSIANSDAKKQNKLNGNDKISENFKNIFNEVENFQQQYQDMKQRNNQRNNKINNLLSKRNDRKLEKEDLFNETERNLNDELSKLYDNNDVKNISHISNNSSIHNRYNNGSHLLNSLLNNKKYK